MWSTPRHVNDCTTVNPPFRTTARGQAAPTASTTGAKPITVTVYSFNACNAQRAWFTLPSVQCCQLTMQNLTYATCMRHGYASWVCRTPDGCPTCSGCLKQTYTVQYIRQFKVYNPLNVAFADGPPHMHVDCILQTDSNNSSVRHM